MRLLHYTLGFAPYRSGGLPRYAHDLLKAQQNIGHKVYALYPGSIELFKKKCYVRYERNK